MDAAEHRRAISAAVAPDLVLRRLQVRDGLALYVGLFGTWSLNHRITVAKIVLATVHAPTAAAAAAPAAALMPDTYSLGDCPWLVLQLQTVDEQQPEFWDRLQEVLRDEFAEAARAERSSDKRCPGRVAFDPSADVHSVRTFADPKALSRYRVRRVNRRPTDHCCPGTAPPNAGARPVATLQRDRIQYTLHRDGNGSNSAAAGATSALPALPLVVWVERDRPRHCMLGHRLHQDYGYVQEGTLLAAASEFRTWIAVTA